MNNSSRGIKIICWTMFWLVLVMIVFERWRLLNIPLERDEGEYAYFGQLLLQGIPPYKLAYNIKLPGIYAVYALCMALFGQSIHGIHLGFLFVNLISIVLIYFISNRLFGFVAGIFSAISYGVLSMSDSVLGAQAHATHFVVVMVLLGLLLLLKAVETEKKKFVFLSGLFFGLAFLMKQPGIFFFPVGFFYFSRVHFKKHHSLKHGLALQLATYTLGATLPLVATGAVLFFTGVFDKFWFWTFQYAFKYSSHLSLYEVLNLFINQFIHVTSSFFFIWCFAVLGFVSVFIDAKAKKNIALVTALLIASLLSVCPGFTFREHYFVTLLPIVALLAGCCVSSVYEYVRDRRGPKFLPMAMFAGLLLCSFYQQKKYFFQSTPAQITRHIYADNPFSESVEIAKYIKSNSAPEETIAVLGSEPQIYFYSQRHSATGYIYTYDLMANQPYALQMQGEMIREIESAKPRFLIWVNVYTSWLWRSESEKLIFSWSKEYIRKFYKKVGVVDIISEKNTDYYWDAEAKNAKPRSPSFVMIFERKK
jgi:hypothetical protein